jgi:hypothetical protein
MKETVSLGGDSLRTLMIRGNKIMYPRWLLHTYLHV